MHGKPGKPTKRPYTEKESVAHWNGRDSSQGRQTPKRPDGDHRKRNCRKEIARLNHGGAQERNSRSYNERGVSKTC